MNFRKATIADIQELVECRKKQLIDEGIEPTIPIDSELFDFFHNKLSDGSLVEWIVVDQEMIIACGAVLFFDFPPSYTNKSGKKAYIANMYTSEPYRGKGLAKQLLLKLVQEVEQAGVSSIFLAASEMGKPVYKKFGFQEKDDYLEYNIT
ncbi:GNAT family N-acetyltransferase [Metabacillus sp. HB246100]|uniref:GNAT family N-acetyltransferase n=1 Tax=Bacillus weihaiensis TaxID=1547283 RepID=UPI002355B60B|nr:GNAT family N-acetyltransferase [Bacillus weihaiensis]